MKIESSRYSGFWSSLLSAIGGGNPGGGGNITNYESKELCQYKNVSGSAIFETPNNDGVTTEQESIV